MCWQVGRLQRFWANLKRDLQALIDHSNHQVKRLGRDLMRPNRELFRHWARYRDGTITRTGMLRLMRPVRHKIDSLLRSGVYGGHLKLQGMGEQLFEHPD